MLDCIQELNYKAISACCLIASLAFVLNNSYIDIEVVVLFHSSSLLAGPGLLTLAWLEGLLFLLLIGRGLGLERDLVDEAKVI